jgi:hypothetical protein
MCPANFWNFNDARPSIRKGFVDALTFHACAVLFTIGFTAN